MGKLEDILKGVPKASDDTDDMDSDTALGEALKEAVKSGSGSDIVKAVKDIVDLGKDD
jgi:hypothetical protein